MRRMLGCGACSKDMIRPVHEGRHQMRLLQGHDPAAIGGLGPGARAETPGAQADTRQLTVEGCFAAAPGPRTRCSPPL